MTPVPTGPFNSDSALDSETPREAADRLYALCDALELRLLLGGQVKELRAQ